MRGEDSACRAKLSWLSMKTFSTHRVTKTLLENSLLPAAKEWFGDEKEGWELQQDKATCHTAKSTKAWLERHEVAVVDGWPTKGDDINPIENLWAILDERLEDKKFKTEEGMEKSNPSSLG